MDRISRNLYNRMFQRDDRKKIVVLNEKNLQCGECGFLSNTEDEAQEHAKLYCHTNFVLSEDIFIDLCCLSCPAHCNSYMALELHKKKTGHTEYEDTEAKRRREEEAEEARRLEEVKAQLVKFFEEDEEKKRIEEEKELMSQARLVAKRDQMISCLQAIKASLKFVEQEERALTTLVTIVKNVSENPAEEKYRKLRISVIEKRLGYVEAGFKFLELCKFEKIERGEFLFLPRYEVEEELFTIAKFLLNLALPKEKAE